MYSEKDWFCKIECVVLEFKIEKLKKHTHEN